MWNWSLNWKSKLVFNFRLDLISLSKRQFWYFNNCLDFSECCCTIKPGLVWHLSTQIRASPGSFTMAKLFDEKILNSVTLLTLPLLALASLGYKTQLQPSYLCCVAKGWQGKYVGTTVEVNHSHLCQKHCWYKYHLNKKPASGQWKRINREQSTRW